MTLAPEYGAPPSWLRVPSQTNSANDSLPTLPMPTLDLAELARQRAEPKRFVIERLAPAGEVTLFTGPGSAGKSLLAQQFATAAAAGLPCLGLSVEAGPAVYLTCEDDPGQLHWRQQHLCEALGADMASLAGKLHLTSRRGEIDNEIVIEPGEVVEGHRYPDQPGAAYNRLARMIRATGARLVFLDNVAHLFPGNENDRGDVTRFCNLLNRLAGETGAAIVLIGHPNKSGDNYSGSTAWLNAVRSQVFIDSERDGDGAVLDPDARVLSVGKANYARKGEALRFRWHNWAYVLESDLPADTRAELAETVKASAENEAFIRCLAAATECKRAVSHNPGPNYAPKVFAGMTEGKKYTAKAFAAAMERLLHLGRIELDAELWQGPNRHWKTGIRQVGKCAKDTRAEAAPNCAIPSVKTAPRTHPYTTYRTGGADDGPPPDPGPCRACGGEGCEWCQP